MANTYTQLYTHIVFHTKSTGIVVRDLDLERVFQYIGTKTYRDEYGDTLKAYGIDYDEHYAFCD